MRRRSFLLSGSCFLLSTASGLGRAQAEERKLVVAVGRASPLSEISLRDLKRLYLGQHLTDPSGQKIISFNQPPGVPGRIHFDERVLDMSPDEVARFWIDRRIRGQPLAPRSVAPVELLIRVLAELPGALGYLFENEADARVKVLPIEGKTPQSPGYPLHAMATRMMDHRRGDGHDTCLPGDAGTHSVPRHR
jgi:hypothetical protein